MTGPYIDKPSATLFYNLYCVHCRHPNGYLPFKTIISKNVLELRKKD